jgi:hypothetical protein
VRLSGALASEDIARLGERARAALERTRHRLVLDLEQLTHLEQEAAHRLAETLRDHRERIRILAPTTLSHPGVKAALAVFALYHGGFGA